MKLNPWMILVAVVCVAFWVQGVRVWGWEGTMIAWGGLGILLIVVASGTRGK